MEILYVVPIWAVYLGTVVLMLIAAEIGFRIGLWRKQRDPSAKISSMRGALVGGLLGLVAFLMAFSIGIVINQHNDRRQMVVTEANAAGTAWLRAGFLDEPAVTDARTLLREYVGVRLAIAENPGQLDDGATRSEEIQGKLWAIAEETVRQGNDSESVALFIESINDVIDVHLLRVTAGTRRLPGILIAVLYGAITLSFLLVGITSSADGKRDFTAILLFALAFVAALIVIVDLNRPQQGMLTVSQAVMEDLLDQMEAAEQ